MRSRIVKISVAAFVVLALVVYNFYDYWMEDRLKDQLSLIINNDPENLYEYSFDRLDIHVMSRVIDLKGITIKPTANAVDSLKSDDSGLRFLLDLHMEKILLEGFDIPKFITTGQISIESLTISEPQFNYYFHPRKKKKVSQVMPLQNVFNDRFKGADLKKFIIKNGHVIIDDQTQEGSAINIEDLNIELTGAHLNPSTLHKFSPFDYKDVKVMASGIYVDASEDFSIVSDTLNVHVERGSIEISNFQLQPKHSQEEFREFYDLQKQWFAIRLDHLTFEGINMDDFIETGLMDIGKVEVKNPSLALYKDKTKPQEEEKEKKLPASLIQSMDWILNIDSISVQNGYITIDEHAEETGLDSRLFLSEVNATILNFTNDSLRTTESSIMYVDADAKVLGKVATNLHLRLDLNNHGDEFQAWGDVGQTEGAVFNDILESQAGMKFKDGIIHNVSFDFKGNKWRSWGVVDTEYEGLKIEILKEDSSVDSKKGIMSFAANSVINSNNLKSSGSYRQGVISEARDMNKGIFAFLWKSIQSGLVSVMAPFTNDKETKLQQKAVRKEMKKDRKDNG